MKKSIIFCAVLIILMGISYFSVTAKTADTVAVIPDYEIIIDDASVYYYDSLYPFLNYKGVTYLPMTYEYAKGMNLTTGYLEGSAFMVAYNPSDDKLPVYKTTNNSKYNSVVIPTYNIYVNGKKVDNKTEEYPLINFRGVTYFPMTWDYAVNEFGWQISFENNILKITTENNSVKRYTIEEKRENDVVLRKYYDREIPLGDGSFKSEYVEEFYGIDYESGNAVKLDDYIQKAGSPLQTNTKVELDVKNGEVFYNGSKLENIYIEMASDDYAKPENVVEHGYNLTAFTSDIYLPLNVVEVKLYTMNYGTNGNFGRNETYTYINVNGKLEYIGKYITVENVYTLGDDIFFNTVDYAQTIFRHYHTNRKLWKLSKYGVISEIKYADYNSMKIIGYANDKLYLKCMWSPENNMDWAPFSVSLVNDGYYTFDGEGIRFISPYIYSDFDIVSPNGNIYAVNNKLDKITKCYINPEYY